MPQLLFFAPEEQPNEFVVIDTEDMTDAEAEAEYGNIPYRKISLSVSGPELSSWPTDRPLIPE